ncbi:unnamed protein product [Caenorhabditis nigoni]
MGNLKILELCYPINLRVDDFLTLNAKIIILDTDQISLRDLNRFFKLWKKGSNPKLEEFIIYWKTEIIPDWKVLLKGLKAKGAEKEKWKMFKIQNCRGICAEIRMNHVGPYADLKFTVSN